MNDLAFSKICIVIILIILVVGGFFTWQYWRLMEEEVKIPEGVTKNEITNWKTYRNEKHGFEIKHPNEWKVNEDIVGAVFTWDGVRFALSVNNYGDIGAWSGCRIATKEIIVEKMKVHPTIYTNLEEKEFPESKEECNQLPLGDYHLIYGEFCVNKSNQYLGNYCEEFTGNFYYQFFLTCEGKEWKGREKMKKCSQLLSQILSTFRFVGEDKTANWKTYQSSDSVLRSQIIPVGETQESIVQIRTNEDILLQEADYSSEDGDHGLRVVRAEWTPDSQFFIYSAASSGGHQPWFSRVYLYSRSNNKIYSFSEVSGFTVASDEFIVTAPDIVTFTVYTSVGMGPTATKSFKLDNVINDIENLSK